MFSKEFMKYLSGFNAKSSIDETRNVTQQTTKSMFYLILKSCNNTPKKA